MLRFVVRVCLLVVMSKADPLFAAAARAAVCDAPTTFSRCLETEKVVYEPCIHSTDAAGSTLHNNNTSMTTAAQAVNTVAQTFLLQPRLPTPSPSIASGSTVQNNKNLRTTAQAVVQALPPSQFMFQPQQPTPFARFEDGALCLEMHEPHMHHTDTAAATSTVHNNSMLMVAAQAVAETLPLPSSPVASSKSTKRDTPSSSSPAHPHSHPHSPTPHLLQPRPPTPSAQFEYGALCLETATGMHEHHTDAAATPVGHNNITPAVAQTSSAPAASFLSTKREIPSLPPHSHPHPPFVLQPHPPTPLSQFEDGVPCMGTARDVHEHRTHHTYAAAASTVHDNNTLTTAPKNFKDRPICHEKAMPAPHRNDAAGTSLLRVNECPSGMFFTAGEDKTKHIDDTKCTPCPAGTYQQKSSQTECIIKPNTCPASDSLCQWCRDRIEVDSDAHKKQECNPIPVTTKALPSTIAQDASTVPNMDGVDQNANDSDVVPQGPGDDDDGDKASDGADGVQTSSSSSSTIVGVLAAAAVVVARLAAFYIHSNTKSEGHDGSSNYEKCSQPIMSFDFRVPTLRPFFRGVRLSLLLLPFCVAGASAAAAPIFCAARDNSGPVGYDGGPRAEVAETSAGLPGTMSSNERAFAMLLADGSVVTWGPAGFGGTGASKDKTEAPKDKGYVAIYSNRYAFAALKEDGSVFTWGSTGWSSAQKDLGGARSNAPKDKGYVTIFSNRGAFAGLKADGTIFSWGYRTTGGAGLLDRYGKDGKTYGKGVGAIYGNANAFAAVKNVKSKYDQINTWGSSDAGGRGEELTHGGGGCLGNSCSYDPRRYAVLSPKGDGFDTIYSTYSTFAALSNEGSITSWGKKIEGKCVKHGLCKRSDCCREPPSSKDKGYVAIYANHHAFCALKDDGSIFCWLCWSGCKDPQLCGFQQGSTGAPTDKGYIAIYSTGQAFAAIKDDGSVVAWGKREAASDGSDGRDGCSYGGACGAPTDKGYVAVYSTSSAFAAIKEDGSVFSWGRNIGKPNPQSCPVGTFVYGYGSFCCRVNRDDNGNPLAFSSGDVCASDLDADGKRKNNNKISCPFNDKGNDRVKSNLKKGLPAGWQLCKAAYTSRETEAPKDKGYVAIYGNSNAFAAIKADGTIFSWGSVKSGGTGAPTDKGYTVIHSTNAAFAAVKEDGSLFCWGNSEWGGTGCPRSVSAGATFAGTSHDGSNSNRCADGTRLISTTSTSATTTTSSSTTSTASTTTATTTTATTTTATTTTATTTTSTATATTTTTTTYKPGSCNGMFEAKSCGSTILKADCISGKAHKECPVMCGLACTSTTTTTTTTTATDTTTTTTTATETTTTTLFTCGRGEYVYVSWLDQTCRQCMYGTFREEEAHSELDCAPWVKCAQHEYIVEKASAVQNNICATPGDCADGEFEYRPPKPGVRDRQCKPLTQCVPGEYIYTPATSKSDQRCRRCDRSFASFAGGMCTSTTRTYTTRTATSKTRTSTTDTTSTPTTSTTTSTTTTTSVTNASTPSTTTLNAGQLKADGVTIAMLIDAMEERRVASSSQVADLLAKGFTLDEVVEAGFSKTNILKPVNVITGIPLITEEEYLAAVDALSVQNESANPKSSSTTTTVVVVGILAVVLVVVGAAIFVSRKQTTGTEESTPSFSNPAYGDAPTSSAAVAVYMDVNASAAAQSAGYMDMDVQTSEEGAAVAGYMDVNPSAAAPSSTGYMDITPAAAQSAGYMDVQPSGETFGGFESASQSDEEV